MDLATGWDSTASRHRVAAEEYVRRAKPRLVVGSPDCSMCSTLQNLSKWTEEREQRLKEAKAQVRFAVKLYKVQVDQFKLR